MATRAQKVKVGIFLVVGLALVVAIFGSLSVKKKEPAEPYFIKFQESVRGLGKDSAVLYKGVPVGKVQNIGLNEENEIIVEVGIMKGRVRLREGTLATLNISSLMGAVQIELSGGDPRAPALKPRAFIPSQPSVLANLAASLPEILTDIRNILAKLNKGLGEIRADRLVDLVRDTDDVVQTANEALAEIAFFLETTKDAVLITEERLSRALQAVEETTVPVRQTFTRLGDDPSSIFWGRSKASHPRVK